MAGARRLLMVCAGLVIGAPFAAAAVLAQAGATEAGSAAGNAAGLPAILLPVPVIVDSRVADESVNIRVTPSGERAAVPKAAVVRLIGPRLGAAARAALEGLAATEGYITPAALRRIGLEARFDKSRLALVINIPPAMLAPIAITGSRPSAPPANLVPPAEATAYMNFFLTQEGRSAPGRGFEREPLEVFMDGAVRFGGAGGLTVEGAGRYKEDKGFERGDIRAVYDLPEQLVRVTAGDLRYRVLGFQSAVPLVGVSVARELRLQPNRLIGPRGEQAFTVERPAEVTIEVDGVIVRRLQLEPGRYIVRDLARDLGASVVTITIYDGSGPPRVLTFSVFAGAELLGRGVSDFALALGGRSREGPSGRVYDFSEPIVSGFYRYGLSDRLTLGIHLQADSDEALVGADAALAAGFGVLSVIAAGSFIGQETGVAVGLDYSAGFDAFGLEDNARMAVSLTYTSRGFNKFSSTDEEDAARDSGPISAQPVIGDVLVEARQPDVDVPDRLRLNATFGVALSRHVSTSLTASWLDARGGGDELRLRPAVALQLPYRINLRLIGEVATGDSGTDYGVTLAFRVPLGDTGTLNATVDASTGDGAGFRTSYRHGGLTNRVGAYGYGLVAEADADTRSLQADLSYAGNRFIAKVDIAVKQGPAGIAKAAAVNLGTALAFADGHFAIGRPIEEGFAVVYRHETLADKRVEVEPSEAGPVATTGWLGPALVPDLRPYAVEPLGYTVNELPIGYDLGAQRFVVRVPYRSGVALRVGSAAVVSVLGTAVGPQGEPLSLVTGEVVAADGKLPGGPKVFFTNTAGRFALQRLTPGRYTINVLIEGEPYVASFHIPKGTVGLQRLHELRFEPAGK